MLSSSLPWKRSAAMTRGLYDAVPFTAFTCPLGRNQCVRVPFGGQGLSGKRVTTDGTRWSRLRSLHRRHEVLVQHRSGLVRRARLFEDRSFLLLVLCRTVGP